MSKGVRQTCEEPNEAQLMVHILKLFSHWIQYQIGNPFNVELSLNGAPLSMQVDTGASATNISNSTYSTLWEVPPPLSESTVTLKTYTGEVIPVLGTLKTLVSYKQQSHNSTCLWSKEMDHLYLVEIGNFGYSS